jgi:hypothetical protein
VDYFPAISLLLISPVLETIRTAWLHEHSFFLLASQVLGTPHIIPSWLRAVELHIILNCPMPGRHFVSQIMGAFLNEDCWEVHYDAFVDSIKDHFLDHPAKLYESEWYNRYHRTSSTIAFHLFH